MKNGILPKMALLLVIVSLALVILPAFAIIIEEAQDTDIGSVTWAWAYVKGTKDPDSERYTNTWHDHYSDTPGSQGYCDWWVQYDSNIRWLDERGYIVYAASETTTWPHDQWLDADAFAGI